MDKSKEISMPIIYMREVDEVIQAAGITHYSTHEIVLPPCMIENPDYIPPDEDVSILSLDAKTFYEYIRVDKIAGIATLFGYDVRYDPNATEMALVPKQVDPPLPFE